jgi:O-antigen/teichoic acid export membrane protein
VTVFSGIRAILPPQADYPRNSFYKPLPIGLRGNEVAQLFTRQESVFQSLQITLLFLVFLKAVNFLKNVFFARLLGPSEFGQLTLFLMIIYIIKQVATFGIGAVHTRYAPEFKLQQALKTFFSKTFVCGAVFISASAITVWVFSRHLALFVFKNSAVTPTVTASWSLFPLLLWNCISPLCRVYETSKSNRYWSSAAGFYFLCSGRLAY